MADLTLDLLGRLGRGEFVGALGDVFEHSPWVAEGAFNDRPFASVEALHAAMTRVVREAPRAAQLALLRAQCPCASCREQRNAPPDPFRVLSASEAAAVPMLVDIEPVGRYGLRLVWFDGHNTGIFTYEYLRNLCPCPECVGRRTA